MKWQPISLDDLKSLLARELAACSDGMREFFARIRIPPVKWRQSPWGDQGGGFWAVALHQDRVLWFNDIEDGFNVSRFISVGEIPDDEYWCNQDELRWALSRLDGDVGTRLGPPVAAPPDQ